MSEHGPLPQTLGRYRVIRRLGAGGMAEVFLARQTGAEGIEKVLVVKRVLPTFARSAKFRTMFIDEAKVALRLNHPNIVQVYAFEQVREEFLLAMELVDGLDLGRLTRVHDRPPVNWRLRLAPTKPPFGHEHSEYGPREKAVPRGQHVGEFERRGC